MNAFDKNQTGLPYKESPEYVEQLIGRCKETAMQAGQKSAQRVVRPWFYAAVSLAAAAAIALGVFLSVRPSSPLDPFLASLTEEECAQLPDWTIDEIPEY